MVEHMKKLTNGDSSLRRIEARAQAKLIQTKVRECEHKIMGT